MVCGVFFSPKLDYEFKHQNNCVSICCDLKTKTYLPGESLYTEFIFTISVQVPDISQLSQRHGQERCHKRPLSA